MKGRFSILIYLDNPDLEESAQNHSIFQRVIICRHCYALSPRIFGFLRVRGYAG